MIWQLPDHFGEVTTEPDRVRVLEHLSAAEMPGQPVDATKS